MRSFDITKGFVTSGLNAQTDPDPYGVPPIMPGPNLPDIAGSYLVLTRYGGDDFELDGVEDTFTWQARSVGKQNDYTSAEKLADDVDKVFTSHRSSRVGGLWVSRIQRVGGAPSVLMTDDADRTHFVCSYIASVQSALVS